MSLTQRGRAKLIAASYKNWEIQGKKVLDIGCGNGVVSKVLSERLNLDLYGTDIIDYCKFDIRFQKMAQLDHLPFADQSFDYAMFNCVLHHTKDVGTSINEAARVAKHLLIFEDDPNALTRIADVVLNFFYSREMAVPLTFKNESEWCRLFAQLGFEYEIQKVKRPLWYPLKHLAFKLTKLAPEETRKDAEKTS